MRDAKLWRTKTTTKGRAGKCKKRQNKNGSKQKKEANRKRREGKRGCLCLMERPDTCLAHSNQTACQPVHVETKPDATTNTQRKAKPMAMGEKTENETKRREEKRKEKKRNREKRGIPARHRREGGKQAMLRVGKTKVVVVMCVVLLMSTLRQQRSN